MLLGAFQKADFDEFNLIHSNEKLTKTPHQVNLVIILFQMLSNVLKNQLKKTITLNKYHVAESENPFLTFSVAYDEEEKPPASPRFNDSDEELDIPDEENPKIGTPDCKSEHNFVIRQIPTTPGSGSISKRVLEKSDNTVKRINYLPKNQLCCYTTSKFQAEESKSNIALPPQKQDLDKNSPRNGVKHQQKPEINCTNARKHLQGFE